MRSAVAILVLSLACVASGQHKLTVCIDPGHPSEVGRGTRGKKLTEIQVNWMIAQLLEQRLKKAGFEVVMTKKSEGEFVRNKRRAEIANDAKADLMVRLHCDAASGSGFTVYYPTKQGKAEGTKGPSKSVIERSAKLAVLFHDTFAKDLAGKLEDNGLLSDDRTAVGRKQGALTGSVYSKVPVVLIEMCVLTNRKDEKFMLSKAGQAAVADALAHATLAAIGKATTW